MFKQNYKPYNVSIDEKATFYRRLEGYKTIKHPVTTINNGTVAINVATSETAVY